MTTATTSFKPRTSATGRPMAYRRTHRLAMRTLGGMSSSAHCLPTPWQAPEVCLQPAPALLQAPATLAVGIYTVGPEVDALVWGCPDLRY